MLIDVSYFTRGPRHVMNAYSSGVPEINSAAVNNTIKGYIDHYLPVFLCEILGCELAQKFIDYLKKDLPEEERLKDYELVCEKIRESFADYVFFHMLRRIGEEVTITGVVQLKCANTYLSPMSLQVRTWNEMVYRNTLFLKFAKSKQCPFKITVSRNLLTPVNAFNL